jgi:hypothetical protein
VGVLGDVVGQDVAGFEPGRRLLPADPRRQDLPAFASP